MNSLYEALLANLRLPTWEKFRAFEMSIFDDFNFSKFKLEILDYPSFNPFEGLSLLLDNILSDFWKKMGEMRTIDG